MRNDAYGLQDAVEVEVREAGVGQLAQLDLGRLAQDGGAAGGRVRGPQHGHAPLHLLRHLRLDGLQGVQAVQLEHLQLTDRTVNLGCEFATSTKSLNQRIKIIL